MMSAGDIFLFGATSMLGWSILQAAPRAVTAFCNGYTRRPPAGVERGIHLDDPVAMYELFATERPHLIVHCAGVCDVEKCKQSPEFAYSFRGPSLSGFVRSAPCPGSSPTGSSPSSEPR
jgi:dTDP-4-dehydrorhamnose reductase